MVRKVWEQKKMLKYAVRVIACEVPRPQVLKEVQTEEESSVLDLIYFKFYGPKAMPVILPY